jgi:hypothetical protein
MTTTQEIPDHVYKSAKFPVGLLVGEPDGPEIYVPSLGLMTPSFIDPRLELAPRAPNATRLSHHIPRNQRGPYKLKSLPNDYRQEIENDESLRLDELGFVMCSSTAKAGTPCGNRAQNRSGQCQNHGGALHPCDKVIIDGSATTTALQATNPDRMATLNRMQRLSGGLLTIDEISDEEVIGCFILDDDGKKIHTGKLLPKVQKLLVKELHSRMQNYMNMKLPSMLRRVNDIAMSDMAEPETSLKASIWLAERVIGKTPDVLIHGTTDAPYSSILENMDRVQSGSREDYRKGLSVDSGSNQRAITQGISDDADENRIIDVSIVDDTELEPDESVEHEKADDADSSETGLSTHSDDSQNSGLSRVDDLVRRRNAAQELVKARKKAKQKRFASRYLGGGLDGTDLPWLVLWRRFQGQDGSVCYTGTPVCPDDQNEAMLVKIARSELDTDERT